MNNFQKNILIAVVTVCVLLISTLTVYAGSEKTDQIENIRAPMPEPIICYADPAEEIIVNTDVPEPIICYADPAEEIIVNTDVPEPIICYAGPIEVMNLNI
ncbi:hypothetical protein MsAm2_14940 [Methanolapillus ohkumae]|uniref:Uncharacterized protein n=2 Tax=Methanolapillus ohkumae TaxID=3028298 RepID=A0AA96V6Y7_9EURY|nr:hypothetical protein MsAm2_14940 [Methanosarcinaceae archaeon Am2]